MYVNILFLTKLSMYIFISIMDSWFSRLKSDTIIIYFDAQLSHIWPVEAHSSLLTYPIILWMFPCLSFFLFFFSTNHCELILSFSCSSSEISYFSQKPDFFFFFKWKMCLETKVWNDGCACCYPGIATTHRPSLCKQFLIPAALASLCPTGTPASHCRCWFPAWLCSALPLLIHLSPPTGSPSSVLSDSNTLCWPTAPYEVLLSRLGLWNSVPRHHHSPSCGDTRLYPAQTWIVHWGYHPFEWLSSSC